MTFERFKQVVAIPGLIMGAVMAIAWLVTLLNTGKRLDGHVVQESVYHRLSDSALRELHGHATDNEKLLEALARGECIENPRADLARQGLLAKCRQLGIDR